MKLKHKQSEFKFDLGFGKLKFNVDYITLTSLVKINEYFDQNEVESCDSMSEKEPDDSDDFVLITTSGDFEEQQKLKKDVDFETKLVGNENEKNENDITQKQALTLEKKNSSTDSYEFDTEALFKNRVNPSNKIFKISFDEEQQRLRCNSDNTACSRFKNILSNVKSPDQNVNAPKVFQKQQFEYKNCLSPSIMENFVIDECYFDENNSQENTKENSKESSSNVRSRNRSGFEDDDFNPFNFQTSNNSEASGSHMGDQQSVKGPAFRGLREFRTSIDGTNDPTEQGRPNSSLFGKTHKQRKFTLSFDGNSKVSPEAEDFLIKFDEGSSPVFNPSSFKHAEKREQNSDTSFEFHIEDDYFTDNLSDSNSKNVQNSTKEKEENKGELFPAFTDRITRESTQGSNSKNTRSNEQSNVFESSHFESLLFSLQQACSDTCDNSNDDGALFLYHIDDIRKKLDSQLEQSDDSKTTGPNKDDKFQLKEAMLNNYVEIMELRDKIKDNTFDSILN